MEDALVKHNFPLTHSLTHSLLVLSVIRCHPPPSFLGGIYSVGTNVEWVSDGPKPTNVEWVSDGPKPAMVIRAILLIPYPPSF
jgi:hypothetical protein